MDWSPLPMTRLKDVGTNGGRMRTFGGKPASATASEAACQNAKTSTQVTAPFEIGHMGPEDDEEGRLPNTAGCSTLSIMNVCAEFSVGLMIR
jgi:hypothetical protein